MTTLELFQKLAKVGLQVENITIEIDDHEFYEEMYIPLRDDV